jgi:hypothetical protein
VRIDETRHRLRDWTQGQAPSEGLAAQILHAEGYEDIDPSHPLGGRDGGTDAMMVKNGSSWIMAVYFPGGPVEFRELKQKVIDDYAGVQKNEAHGMAFVTNQHITRGERVALKDAVGGRLELFHLERVTTILDRPAMASVREQYLDIPADPGGLEADARLQELWRGSEARCVARWMAAGLSRDDATRLAADQGVGDPRDGLRPSENSPMIVWTAELGSGKSIAAERVHQRAIQDAATRADAPIPVFLPATEAAEGLQASVRSAAAEIGEPRRRGADVVVDGVDEVGADAAETLLEQARVLVGTWPSTKVLLTSRPVSVLTGAPEHRMLPPLDEDEQRECIALGAAGREVPAVWLHQLTPEVREVLRRPLFALLAGLWLRNNEGVPRAPVELLAELGRRARATGADEPRLRALAVRSVARDLGPIQAAEVGTEQQVEALLLTGMVARSRNGVAFALPALAQWFAAQSLLLGETNAEQLLAAPEDLELWRYPVALAVALGSWEQSNACLRPLFGHAPGFTFRVLDVAFAQALTFGNPAPPWREAGEQVREALQATLDAVGEARTLFSLADASGRLRPMAVSTVDDSVTVAFWQGEDDRPEVFAMPSGVGLFTHDWDWGPIRMARVGPGATWAWQWARDTFKGELAQRVKSRSFPIPFDGPLADEVVWAFACAQSRRSALFKESLPIEPLVAAINEAIDLATDDVHGTPDALSMVFSPSESGYDAFAVRSYLERRLEAGESEIRAPLPAANRRPEGGGLIGEFYSDERLVEIAAALYRQAVVAYRQLVDRWLRPLADRLEQRVLMPMRIIGEVYPGNPETYGRLPSLSGHIEPLPEGAEDEVVMSLTDRPYDLNNPDDQFYAEQQRLRPLAARWLPGTRGGMSFEVGRSRPLADAVYAWLARDLERLGLAGRLDGRTSDEHTVWERQEQ